MISRTEKHNDATNNRPEGERALDAPILHINLPDYIRQIKSEVAWQNSDRNAITLLHNDHLWMVLVALKEGAEMKRHSVEATIAIQLFSGRLWIESEAQSFSLDEDEVAALQAILQHYIFAEEESVFLLTFTGSHTGEF